VRSARHGRRRRRLAPDSARRAQAQENRRPPVIEWEPAPDILAAIAPRKKSSQVFCGFAAETRSLAREAKRKLREKNLDAIAANDVSRTDRGFDSDRNELAVFFADGSQRRIPLARKSVCAARLIAWLGKIAAKKK
jgi:phosphopantothenoylcysteine decarboxylase/phosphopantothenate--cysteine ligase